MNYGYVAAALAVIFGVTYSLRGVPFVALRRVRDSELMRIVAQTMPLGVMVILVTFTVSGVKFGVLASWLPALGGIVVTALVHWRWANALVSIVVGVGAFWVLGQVLA
ncbi:AzlD domain-containing protein [Winkia sp. ACRQY]|uniref:Branched-chain amino acid transporter AzlD n=2 Tax=Winkia neuii TaxID=33007 RepID=K0ZCJ6_9ACTO|nr:MULTISPECIES: AzlD domain-containing protein [Winkia]MCG7302712.1 AzlD domain-containing protein [Winkia sp. ACRQY]PLB80151.1 branched-chain amino acid ABC transporter [Actinomyces sp. UMB0138]EJZ85180.1 hypothetical protein HMPREF9240_01667 [Winkia neuii BV029A5]MDK7163047.1 AzlD domain-containing protein [Winkia sp. UMB3105]MDK7905898.1 AzlD domain-containing protein [Winkia sp. UMB0889B]